MSLPNEKYYKDRNLIFPYYRKHPELQKTNYVRHCKNCKDTSFVMLDGKKNLNICARCGKKF